MHASAFRCGLAIALLLAASACHRDGTQVADNGVRQTHYPGEVTSGGGTSGEVMARNPAPIAPTGNQSGTPGIPQGAGGNTGGPQTAGTTNAAGGASGSETTRGQSESGGVKGTPSIPEGAGGNPSGAEMGGTTPGAAATKNAPQPEHGSKPAAGGGKQ